MTSHTPARPSWICEGCDEPWPCRLAVDDLGEPGPVVLYQRFVAWTLPPGYKCRVCHKPRHDVLPGLPPRLFPCGKIHEVLL